MRFTRSYTTRALTILAIGALAACSSSKPMDDQLRADLAAASMPRSQFVSPMELGPNGAYPPLPPGYAYAPQYPQTTYGYPQARVVYAPTPVVSRSPARRTASAGGGGGSATSSGPAPQRNTKRGAVIGAATGAAVGILTSRDKVKGGAVGAVAGAVLGGVVGSQIYTKPRR